MKQKPLMAGSLALVLAGCASMPGGGESTAEAKLQPTRDYNTSGTVTFTQKGDKVLVVANISGLTPGSHGFHVHEKGDCSAADGMSAGGHFNPGGKPHGNPHQGEHHAGDMPMLEADANGNALLTTELSSMALRDGPANIIGKAVIVHVSPDDFKTQPTGNSGARMACGVIAKR